MKRHLPGMLFVFALLLLAGVCVLNYYPLLKLNGVRIVGTERITTDELGLAAGDNLFAVDTKGVIDTLLAFPFVAAAAARFDLQGNLIITVTEKEPVCYLYDGGLYGLSCQGELLPLEDNGSGSLPVIRGVRLRNSEVYQTVRHTGLNAALKLVNLMGRRSPNTLAKTSEIMVTNEGLELILEPGTVVAKLGWGEYQDKIDMLELVLSDNQNPALALDLRFKRMAILEKRFSNREVKHGV
ncbi:MAG: FtsQ-type POTRA domain-containing protein [candidate division Zixibacteria bacterium]|nr:FtsQ-type POTRA domain-containing protein [candidate division Zixibacteria bacterium]